MIEYVPYAIPLLIFLSGMVMMFRVWNIWDEEAADSKNAEERQYAYRKFRRRSLIGSMLAIVGALLGAVMISEEPRARLIMTIAMLLILMAILFYAAFDMLCVFVHHNHGRAAGEARKRMAEEYKRLRSQMENGQSESEGNQSS